MAGQKTPTALGTEIIGKLLMQYAVPAIISMSASSLYNMVDSIFIGHGVGIELNEQPAITPRSKDTLLEDMTLAIEPKFVIPEIGAVGVENTYVVAPDGLQNITPFPEEIQEL